jgi:hypothetical protein
MFTATESIWYLRALIGLTDRRAEYYVKSDSNMRELFEKNTIKYGAEFGIRWYMFQSSIGIYDSRFFFTIGYRLGFQIGI